MTIGTTIDRRPRGESGQDREREEHGGNTVGESRSIVIVIIESGHTIPLNIACNCYAVDTCECGLTMETICSLL